MNAEALELIKSLQEKNQQLERENLSLKEEAGSLKVKVERLEDQLSGLLRRLYGRRSERFVDPNQRTLFDYIEAEDLPQDVEQPEEIESFTVKRRKPRKRGPKPLPEHLPRERIEIDPSEGERTCACCRNPMQRIDEVVNEELDIIPPQFRVKQYVRGKWSCPECMNQSVMKPLPPRPIDQGRASPRLLAYIITSKYCDHTPLYRQEQIFGRFGIDLSRKTMDSWLGQLSGLLLAVVLSLKRQILKEPLLQMDDTPIQVLDPQLKGKTRRCYLWAYTIPGAEVVYDFTESRAGRGPLRFLGDYSGDIQCDEFSGNREIFRSGHGRKRVACMAHIRRKLFEAKDAAPDRVEEILDIIKNLYAVEDEARERELGPEERVKLREEESESLMGRLKSKIDELSPLTSPGSKLGRAVSYAEKNWPEMMRYLTVGASEIDNNSCENAIRPVALGRKNFLFLGSAQGGGERAEVFYSLIQSCRRLGFDPFSYLSDIIERISTHPQSRIDELTPRGWLESREKAEKETVASCR